MPISTKNNQSTGMTRMPKIGCSQIRLQEKGERRAVKVFTTTCAIYKRGVRQEESD